MKTKVLSAAVARPCTPLAAATNSSAYPSEKVAEFVVTKLDLNSLPPAFRPRKEKGEKTFVDSGFRAQGIDEREAIAEAPSGAKGLKAEVLDRKPSGIYVCIAEPGQNSAETKTQSVVLLKRKGPNSLLKGREPF